MEKELAASNCVMGSMRNMLLFLALLPVRASPAEILEEWFRRHLAASRATSGSSGIRP